MSARKPTKADKERYKLSESKRDPIIVKLATIILKFLQFLCLFAAGLFAGVNDEKIFSIYLSLWFIISLFFNIVNKIDKYNLIKQAEDGELLED